MPEGNTTEEQFVISTKLQKTVAIVCSGPFEAMGASQFSLSMVKSTDLSIKVSRQKHDVRTFRLA
jgi:hypothetical protein